MSRKTVPMLRAEPHVELTLTRIVAVALCATSIAGAFAGFSSGQLARPEIHSAVWVAAVIALSGIAGAVGGAAVRAARNGGKFARRTSIVGILIAVAGYSWLGISPVQLADGPIQEVGFLVFSGTAIFAALAASSAAVHFGAVGTGPALDRREVTPWTDHWL